MKLNWETRTDAPETFASIPTTPRELTYAKIGTDSSTHFKATGENVSYTIKGKRPLFILVFSSRWDNAFKVSSSTAHSTIEDAKEAAQEFENHWHLNG